MSLTEPTEPQRKTKVCRAVRFDFPFKNQITTLCLSVLERSGREKKIQEAGKKIWKVDLALLHQIENPALLDHIRRVGVLFYPLQG
jgi:hypothetical protein